MSQHPEHHAPAPPSSATSAAKPVVPVRAVSSEALFEGAQELQIEHRGAFYRLRQTSLGKLILTK